MSDTGHISDGFHTFDELYAHRGALFMALCRALPAQCWKSRYHSDGTCFEGWFIAGLFREPGRQITYHFPLVDWDKVHAAELPRAPEWDGHSPADVVSRLRNLKV